MKQSKKHAMKQFAISMAAVVLALGLPADWAVQGGFAYAAAQSGFAYAVAQNGPKNIKISGQVSPVYHRNDFFSEEEYEKLRALQEPLAQERSAAYKKLLKYKTEDYLQQSVAAFNASISLTRDISPTRDALGEALEAYAQVTAEGIDPRDENYEFLTVTLQASLSELYCEVFVDDTPYFPIYLSRKERPYAYMGPTGGDMFYEFMFYALVNVSYRVTSPETLTVEERDRVLRTCRKELQSYVDSLSEEEILNGNIKAALTRKAEELAFRYSGDGMELSIEIGHIDMFDM